METCPKCKGEMEHGELHGVVSWATVTRVLVPRPPQGGGGEPPTGGESGEEEPPERPAKLRIKLADSKERTIQHMSATMF